MKSSATLFGIPAVAALGLLILAVAPRLTQDAANSESTKAANRERKELAEGFGTLPLHFEPNEGQAGNDVRYLSRGAGYTLLLKSSEAVLALRKPLAEPRAKAKRIVRGEEAERETSSERNEEQRSRQPVAVSAAASEVTDPNLVDQPLARPTIVRMKLLGADQQPRLTGLTKLPGKSNYFLGNDPDRWRTDIPHYGRVQYHDVYPGIDLVYYGTQGELEYDFVVAPGADPSAIQLKFEGVRDVRIDARDDLVLETESGQIRQRKPFVYQHVNGVKREISGTYALRQDQTVSFELGDYDPTQSLVIDPVLIYSTLIGGSGREFGLAIDIDSSGNVYATGLTDSADFPGASPIQSDFGGGSQDIFVAKLNASGTALIYSTYLGGSGSDAGLDIAVDTAGNAYVTGRTNSADFPQVNALQPAFGGGGQDAIVANLDPSGSSLIYSSYLGGSGRETDNRIAVDSAGNACLTGKTDSPDFPTANALQPAYGGGRWDAYVAKLNATGSAFIYSTYLGGSGAETEFSSGGIAVDFDGNAYVTGSTDSVDFPTVNALQPTRRGSADAFIAKLNPAGSAFIYSTYLGRNAGGAEANDIAVDAAGNAYVTGYTTGFTRSSSFPGAGPPPFPPGPGVLPFDGFVSKLNAAGSALVYSRYIATPGDDFGEGITVDAAGNAWVIGSTGGEFPVTPDALFPIGGGGSFVVRLDSAGDMVYATFFPPVADIAVDGSGNVYLTGSISNFALPLITPGAFQTAIRGGVDAYVVKFGGEGVPVTTVSAAGFQGRQLAADSIVSSFAPDFAERVTQADRIPLPTELDGITIAVIDSTLTEYLAGLIVVTPLQINWVMPPQVAEGPAKVTVTTQDGRIFSGVVTIGAIAPALFSANADGMGVAAASILRINADGSRSTAFVFDPNVAPPRRAGVPVNLGGEADQVFLVLFGTGIRGRGEESAVGVTIGGEPVEVQFSGPQGEFVGLDQVNVGPLPRSLIGRGELDIALTVDDKQANIVTVNIGAGPPATPTLISPINNATIPQNDPTIGCPSHPTRGFGYLVKFDWTDATSPHGIAGYEIFAKARTAQFPIVDTFVVPSEFTRASCNVFVIDPNLEGQEWRVRARDTRGQLGPWSATGLYTFAPCRLADGRPCNAPPEAAALPRRLPAQR